MAGETVKGCCPRCGKTIRWEGNLYRPFCSGRCKLIDLGKWIDQEYRIAGEDSVPKAQQEGRGRGRR